MGTAQHLSLSSPVVRDRLHFPFMEPVSIGMPELCRAGLSENWLLKACGHRHWMALAAAHGLAQPDFRDAEGNRLYPAFTQVRLEEGRLDDVREGERLNFDLMLVRTGRTRFRSVTLVSSEGRPIARLTMHSAFVRRAVEGQNRSATRTLVARPCSLLPPATAMRPPLRVDGWEEHAGFRRAERQELAIHLIDPSPHEDFNGADFLYFTSFQAMLDRAEWYWFRWAASLAMTVEREIIYSGNIELGDRVRATLCGTADVGNEPAHWIELARESDGQLIAVAFTCRAFGFG